jgi:hypothetical protein
VWLKLGKKFQKITPQKNKKGREWQWVKPKSKKRNIYI